MSSSPVLFMHRRSIAGYIPDVIVEERHRDALAITEHPVEIGAQITDHAYKEPAELEMHVMWQSGVAAFASRLFTAQVTNIQELYAALQKLQALRQPFGIVTGKRIYENMLMEELRVDTDERTENALEVHARFRQIILVATTTQKVPGVDGANLPPGANSMTRGGTKQLKAVPDNQQLQYSSGFYGVPSGSGGPT